MYFVVLPICSAFFQWSKFVKYILIFSLHFCENVLKFFTCKLADLCVNDKYRVINLSISSLNYLCFSEILRNN